MRNLEKDKIKKEEKYCDQTNNFKPNRKQFVKNEQIFRFTKRYR